MKRGTKRLLAWARERRRWHPRDTEVGCRGVNRRFIANGLRDGKSRGIVRNILTSSMPRNHLDPPVFA